VNAQLGPRLIGRLTPELILRSPQYMNCVNQYEIDLRGNRIAAIENLGATEVGDNARPVAPARPPRSHVELNFHLLQNQFDSIDLSDNSIVRLEGFPKLPRLQCVHLNNNRINRIARNLEGRPLSVTRGNLLCLRKLNCTLLNRRLLR
jgi:U2 small nuclear ribonucleoprotein A'